MQNLLHLLGLRVFAFWHNDSSRDDDLNLIKEETLRRLNSRGGVIRRVLEIPALFTRFPGYSVILIESELHLLRHFEGQISAK